jgi:hypothetical protein
MKQASQLLLLALSLLLLVAASAHAQRQLPPAPFIVADNNPVVIPGGQTSGTVFLEWDGGTAHPYAEVWVRVDQNDETFIVEQGRGSRNVTVELGKNYEFKLSDSNVLLASVKVTVKQRTAGAQPPPPSGVSPKPLPTPPPAYSVSGAIRWKKDMGTVPMGQGNSSAALAPCSAFSIVATDPGSGQAVVSTDQVTAPFQLSEEGDYYVCSYSLSLPVARRLYMIATMGGIRLLPQEDRSPMYISDAWIGGTRSKPPAGAERGFTGYTYVTVDRRNSRATANFELLYVPIDRGPK